MFFKKNKKEELTTEEKELLLNSNANVSYYKQDLISVSSRKHWIVKKYIKGLIYYGIGCALFTLCCIIGGGIYYWMKPTPLIFFEYADGRVKCAYDTDGNGKNKLSSEQKKICIALEKYGEEKNVKQNQ